MMAEVSEKKEQFCRNTLHLLAYIYNVRPLYTETFTHYSYYAEKLLKGGVGRWE